MEEQDRHRDTRAQAHDERRTGRPTPEEPEVANPTLNPTITPAEPPPGEERGRGEPADDETEEPAKPDG